MALREVIDVTSLVDTVPVWTQSAVVLGWGNRGQCPRNSESGPPCGPPNRESASIIQWQIWCNDFVLKGKAEIKCLNSLLPNQNCWNCKYCFKSHLSLVWMRDLSFFPRVENWLWNWLRCKGAPAKILPRAPNYSGPHWCTCHDPCSTIKESLLTKLLHSGHWVS